jgi:predicted permease
VLLFTLGVSVLAALLFGSFPIVRYGSPNLASSLKEGGRGGGEGRRRHRARNGLVVSQVALALVLLIGSGLMIRSLGELWRVHPGFERPEEILTFNLFIPSAEVEDPGIAVRTHEQILRGIEEIPGVASVGLSTSVPMDGRGYTNMTHVRGLTEASPPSRRYKFVSEGYFETMEIPVLAGRTITWADIHARRPVAVVNERFAREYWADPAAAVGELIAQSPEGGWREVVGVVGNVRDDGPDREARALVYWPMAVETFWGVDVLVMRSLTYAVRTAGVEPLDLLDRVRETVWALNPNLPLADVRTQKAILEDRTARTSFTMVLLSIAAGVALLLGIVGLYGVISYAVSTRTREIGIRMALGARHQAVTRMVLRHGLLLAAVGVAAGLGAAVGLTRLMSALLFGVEPVDPPSFAAPSVALVGIALLASYIPARRAASVDPMDTLRDE